jgi:hypothetical protein
MIEAQAIRCGSDGHAAEHESGVYSEIDVVFPFFSLRNSCRFCAVPGHCDVPWQSVVIEDTLANGSPKRLTRTRNQANQA